MTATSGLGLVWRPPEPPTRAEMDELADWEEKSWILAKARERAYEEGKARLHPKSKALEKLRQGSYWAHKKHTRALEDLLLVYRRSMTYEAWEKTERGISNGSG